MKKAPQVTISPWMSGGDSIVLPPAKILLTENVLCAGSVNDENL